MCCLMRDKIASLGRLVLHASIACAISSIHVYISRFLHTVFYLRFAVSSDHIVLQSRQVSGGESKNQELL